MRRAWWWVQVSAIGLALVVLLAWEDLVVRARSPRGEEGAPPNA